MSCRHAKVVDHPNAGIAAGRMQPTDWGSTATDYTAHPTHVFVGGVDGQVWTRDGTVPQGASWTAVSGGTTDYNALTNKPTLGALAAKNAVDYTTTDVTNKPTLGTAAAQNIGAFDASGAAAAAQAASLPLHGKADTAVAADTAVTLAAGADRTKLDGIASGATVGADWTTNVTNKPMLGAMAAFNDAPSDGSTYGRQNGAWAVPPGASLVAMSDHTPAGSITISAHTSAVVLRKYVIASGTKLTVSSGARFRAL